MIIVDSDDELLDEISASIYFRVFSRVGACMHLFSINQLISNCLNDLSHLEILRIVERESSIFFSSVVNLLGGEMTGVSKVLL